jgi:DeoR family transcriptional regulator, fructose operon transcriptional repressor
MLVFLMPEKLDANSFERHQQILEQAIMQGVARTKDLALEFGVHEMTVRRDMDFLEQRGLLERIHGGAKIVKEASEEVAYSLRSAQRTLEKHRIARAALKLIHDGDTIAIDSSTTGLALVRMLGARDVHALVTGLDAANILALSGVAFTLMGGMYHPPARSFVGSVFSAGLKRFHPDKVFFSSQGFTPEHGFTDAHLPEVEAKELLIKASAQKIALLDSSKFGTRAANQIVAMNAVDMIITEKKPNPETRAALKKAGVQILLTSATS